MLIAETFKKSILQTAIQGKLTQQLPTDGSAKDLLAKIKAEKQKLTAEGKIKKEKPLAPITDDEKPFEIPENWEWVSCGDILSVISGTSYDKSFVQKAGLRIVRGGNIEGTELVIKDDDVFLPKENFYSEEKTVRDNDIVIVASTGSLTAIGRPAFVDKISDKNIQIGAFLRILRLFNKELYSYCKVIFGSYYYRNWISQSVAGIGIRNVKEEYITKFIIPLPPLAEQKRIVEKLEDLLPLCEDLAE